MLAFWRRFFWIAAEVVVLALSPACGVRGGAQRPVASHGPGARRRAGWRRGGRPEPPAPQLRAPGPGRRAAMCTASQPKQHMADLARLRAPEWRR